MEKIKPFFMFDGKAEEAIHFYLGIIPHSAITQITRYKANEQGKEGSVMKAEFTLNGEPYMCIDSPAKHAFGFTPAISFFITCSTEEEIDQLFAQLSDGGSTLMPLGAYPFSKKFGWLADKYGISWQLSL